MVFYFLLFFMHTLTGTELSPPLEPGQRTIIEDIDHLKKVCFHLQPNLQHVKNPITLNHSDQQVRGRYQLLYYILSGQEITEDLLIQTFDTGESYHEWVFESFYGKPFLYFVLASGLCPEATKYLALSSLNAFICFYDVETIKSHRPQDLENLIKYLGENININKMPRPMLDREYHPQTFILNWLSSLQDLKTEILRQKFKDLGIFNPDKKCLSRNEWIGLQVAIARTTFLLLEKIRICQIDLDNEKTCTNGLNSSQFRHTKRKLTTICQSLGSFLDRCRYIKRTQVDSTRYGKMELTLTEQILMRITATLFNQDKPPEEYIEEIVDDVHSFQAHFN
jgi:hypothetical protein